MHFAELAHARRILHLLLAEAVESLGFKAVLHALQTTLKVVFDALETQAQRHVDCVDREEG